MAPIKLSLSYEAIAVLLTLLYCAKPTVGSSISSTLNVEEERPTGFFVVNVAELFKADKMKLSRRKIKFKMLSQKLKAAGSGPRLSPTSWVELNPENGVMTTSRKIDRDAECAGMDSCIVHVQVIMLPQTSFTFLDLELVIDDVNDNAPVFSRDVIEVGISEAWRIGEAFSLDPFQATDADAGENSVLRYELSGDSRFLLKQSTGRGGIHHLQLVVKERLDHEREPSVNMLLTATDGGNPPLQTQIGLTVNVIDANDNAPVFDQEEYSIVLLENSPPGTAINAVSAQDADSGALGEIRYSISARNSRSARRLFAIDPRTGELRLKGKADREEHNGIRVLIEARDSDPTNQKVGEAWLLVSVEDVNDNAPEISTVFILHEEGNTVFISESAPKGTFIFRVSATDADSGDNGNTRLSMETTSPCAGNPDGNSAPEKETFVLHPDGLVATVRPVDRESCDNHIIVVSACDHGDPPKCSSKAIQVQVLDENEFAPKFRTPAQRVTVSENASVGSLVTTVQAYDGDSEGNNAVVMNTNNEILDSRNGEVEYTITNGDVMPFSIGRKSGAIRLLKPLDREENAEWKIAIKAYDGGIPQPLSSGYTVIVTVGDVNDNAPRFLNPRNNDTLLYASTLTDQPIIKVKAVDLDAGRNGEVRYKLLTKESFRSRNSSLVNPRNGRRRISSGNFVLNPTTGELKLNFSRRNFSSILGTHAVKIRAYDMGSISKTGLLRVNVKVIDYPVPLVKSGDMSVTGGYTVLLVVCAVSALFLIMVVVVTAVFLRRRKAKKESKTYNLPKDDDVIMKDGCVMDAASLATHSAEPPIATAQCGNQDKRNFNGAVASSKADTVAKLNHEDMAYLTVVRNVDANTRPHSDGDSGRGDSDSDGTTFKDRSKHLSGQNGMSTLGPNCAEQCLRLGHSDNCWMPLIDNPPNMAHANRPDLFGSRLSNQKNLPAGSSRSSRKRPGVSISNPNKQS